MALHCSRCGANNDGWRALCTACGAALGQADPAAGSPRRTAGPVAAARKSSPFHRPCTNCSMPVALYHAACPACGTQQSAAALPMVRGLPMGWTARALPGGSYSLQRTLWGRINHVGGIAVMLVVWIAFAVLRLSARPLGTELAPSSPYTRLSWTALEVARYGLFAAVLVGGLAVAWLIFQRGWLAEEWIAAPDSLSVRKTFFGKETVRQFQGAELVVEAPHGYVGRRETLWRFFVRSPMGQLTLTEGGWSQTGEVVDQAHFLAGITGWPLRIPDGTGAMIGASGWPL